eukprot:8438687-Pyramimonas_sp.AAC.1
MTTWRNRGRRRSDISGRGRRFPKAIGALRCPRRRWGQLHPRPRAKRVAVLLLAGAVQHHARRSPRAETGVAL